MEITVMTKLMELADEIRALSKQTRESVIAIGNKLIEAKELVGHGNFLPWIETEFKWSESTANNFMQVAIKSVKFTDLADLNVPISALYLLAAPNTPDEAIAAVAEQVKSGETMSLADVKNEIDFAKSRTRPWGQAAKPRDNQIEAIAREHKAKTGEWPTSSHLAKKAEVNSRSADNALRAVKAFEEGQNSQEEKMISIHVLIEKLSPLFDRILAQSKAHRAALSHTELAMIAGEGRRLLDSWASDDPTVRRVRGHVVPPKPRQLKGRKENPNVGLSL